MFIKKYGGEFQVMEVFKLLEQGGTKETFINIKKPLEFRKNFQELC